MPYPASRVAPTTVASGATPPLVVPRPYPAALVLGSIVAATTPFVPTPPPFFEQALIAWLASTFGLTVYPGTIPLGAQLPALSLLLIWGGRDYNLDGSRTMSGPHYQITVESTDPNEVGQLSIQLETALLKFRGFIGPFRVSCVMLANEHSDYTAAANQGAFGVHSRMNEFVFYFN